jgi:hypothetical protein
MVWYLPGRMRHSSTTVILASVVQNCNYQQELSLRSDVTATPPQHTRVTKGMLVACWINTLSFTSRTGYQIIVNLLISKQYKIRIECVVHDHCIVLRQFMYDSCVLHRTMAPLLRTVRPIYIYNTGLPLPSRCYILYFF